MQTAINTSIPHRHKTPYHHVPRARGGQPGCTLRYSPCAATQSFLLFFGASLSFWECPLWGRRVASYIDHRLCVVENNLCSLFSLTAIRASHLLPWGALMGNLTLLVFSKIKLKFRTKHQMRERRCPERGCCKWSIGGTPNTFEQSTLHGVSPDVSHNQTRKSQHIVLGFEGSHGRNTDDEVSHPGYILETAAWIPYIMSALTLRTANCSPPSRLTNKRCEHNTLMISLSFCSTAQITSGQEDYSR